MINKIENILTQIIHAFNGVAVLSSNNSLISVEAALSGLSNK